MIKAIICDLYNVCMTPKSDGTKYDPLAFNFASSFDFNTDLLQTLHDTKLPLYILTNMNRITLDSELVGFFESWGFKIFEAGQLGLDKSTSFAYEFVCKNKLGYTPDVVAFIDDQERNIIASKSANVVSFLYNSKIDTSSANLELKNWLKSLGVS